MSDRIRIGIIGLGRMGKFYLSEMIRSKRWDILYICDVDPYSREQAHLISPDSKIVSDSQIIFEDPQVQAVGLFTLADARSDQIEKALYYGKHILSEKPIAATLEKEWEMVDITEKSDMICTVNLYLRNSWYHNEIKDFIKSGEIGDLAIIRVCHMTPGLAPGEGHEYEGPAFHDCGMHYVDIARWYAESEYHTWHAQAIRMWNYHEPWWLQCHGTFQNGIVFDITQGFVYGQLSKDQTHNSYIDIIGTKGIARMTHDFKTAKVELRGETITQYIEKPFNGKNIDVLCNLFADSIERGEQSMLLPKMRDSAIASDYAWKFLMDAKKNEMPIIGSLDILEKIKERRKNLTNGYGLLRK